MGRRTRTSAATLAAIVAIAGIADFAASTPVARAAVTYPFAPLGSEAIGPGAIHAWGGLTTDTAGSQAVQVVRVDPRDPNVRVEALLSNDTVTGLEKTSSMAARNSVDGHRVVAAVNGDFWSGLTGGALAAPHGLQVHLGELMVAGRGIRPTFGVDAAGSARLADVAETVTLNLGNGTILPISRVNQGRGSNEIVLYTSRFGATTGTAVGGVDVVLAAPAGPIGPSGAYPAVVQSIAAANAPIAPGTVVLSGAGAGANSLYLLTPGQSVTLTTAITPGWETVTEAIGGGEWVVRDGVVNVTPPWYASTQRHPRTGVGVTPDGRVILATIDGGQPGYSSGVRLDEFGQLFIGEGALAAINLDGGGSTTFAARRPGDMLPEIVNRPSDGRERFVSNALAVISLAPAGPLAALGIRPAQDRLVLGTSTAFTAVGWDAAVNPVTIEPSAVSWSASGSGTIDPTGRFLALASGPATIQAAALGLVAQQPTEVIADTVRPVARAPFASFVTGSVAGQDQLPVLVSWPAASDVGTGVASYRLWLSTDDGPYAAIPLAQPLSLSATLQLAPGPTYRFAVDALDNAGNVSPKVAGGLIRQLVIQENGPGVAYSGSWVRRTGSDYHGGAIRSTGSAQARAALTFSGSDVAWVATRGPTSGSARVYLDGRLVATINLYSATTVTRGVVYRAGWPTIGTHRLEIRPVGTAGHPRVNVDAFLVEAIAAPDPVLVGAGDIASCGSTGDSATAKLIAGIPGTVFTAGDNAYPNGSPTNYASCYEPTWGRFKARTRPVPGNHDWVTPGAAGYFGYFGSAVGAPGASWYAYDLGNWRIYALDSNCGQNGGCGPGSPMESWLTADLVANPRTCVMAYWHHPRFSSGLHGNATSMRTIWSDLYAAGADVVVNGHDHDYERFAQLDESGGLDPVNGIREFVVGTGGAERRAFATIQPNSQVRRSGARGVLKLILRPAGYEWSFIPVAGSSGADSGWSSCH